MAHMQTIAFLGTGLIGAGMVEAALRRGERVIVWNRTREKAEPLVKLGATGADSPVSAVCGADRVHLALADDAAVDAVIEAVRTGLRPDAVIVDHTTASPAGTRARAAALSRDGVAFLHAPVFMSPAAARDAKGLMLCAGPEAAFARVKDGLRAMTGDLWFVGERPDLAAAYKLFGNAMILANVAGLADVFAMARSLDVPVPDAFGVFGRFDPSGVLRYRGPRMAHGDFAPSFTMEMARKDVRLMLDAARDADLAVLPGIAAAMDAAIAGGDGGLDVGALAKPK